MWPGQQPPGGEQNPQDQSQNPYQQPGYQQPNPYQQPTQPAFPQQPSYPQQGHPQQGGYPAQGYAQPNPYQQPTVPQYQVPGPPPPQGSGGGGRNRTTLIAVVAAAAVVVAAGVTTFVALNGKNDDKGDKKDVADKPATSSSAPASGTPSTETDAPSDGPTGESDDDNPRGDTAFEPTIPGWKVVHNPRYGTLFDVPPEWEVAKPTTSTGFEDAKKGDGSPLVMMSGPADLKSKWCTYDEDKDGSPETWGLASAGTKGNKGAKDTASAARGQAGIWVWGAFAQHMPEKSIKISAATPYTTASGLKGSMATATAPNVTKRNKCETDGKSLAFTFFNAENDYATFVLYAADGVKDELSDATMRKILSTVRLTKQS
ncbi:hypothetical protein [Streptomyces sp. CC208A]|uniref:hypothetical protein n=1 Tax=Streptomyces sp. CC208A TaxID=3044573 RepID=UPI0024A8BD63|nr:hypothetical protein [Streptomyces sp. CC208A]